MILEIFLGLLIPVALILVVLLLFPSKPITTIVVEKRGNASLVRIMNIMKKRDKSGVDKYILRKKLGDCKNLNDLKGFELPIQDFGNMYMTDKGKSVLFLYRLSEDEFIPMLLDEENKKIKAMDVDLKAWDAIKTQQDIERFRKLETWQKYGFVITVLAVCIGVAIVIYVSNMRMTVSIQEFSSVTNSLRGVVADLKTTAPSLSP